MFRAIGRRFSSLARSEPESFALSTELDALLSARMPVPDYHFSTVTSVSPSYSLHHDNYMSGLNRTKVKDLPEGMDASDVRDLMSRLQRADIERNLAAATTPQERQDILRRAAVDMARKERMWQLRDKTITQNLRARLANVFLTFRDKHSFNIQEVLLLCTTISSLPKCKVAAYDTDYTHAPFKYMVFFTCLNSSHMYMVADTLYKLFAAHGLVHGKPQTLTVQGKESEAWVLVDLDGIGIHLSFGSHREVTACELPLQKVFIPRANWSTLTPAPIKHCNIVLRSPVTMRPAARPPTGGHTLHALKDDVRGSLRQELLG